MPLPSLWNAALFKITLPSSWNAARWKCPFCRKITMTFSVSGGNTKELTLLDFYCFTATFVEQIQPTWLVWSQRHGCAQRISIKVCHMWGKDVKEVLDNGSLQRKLGSILSCMKTAWQVSIIDTLYTVFPDSHFGIFFTSKTLFWTIKS